MKPAPHRNPSTMSDELEKPRSELDDCVCAYLHVSVFRGCKAKIHRCGCVQSWGPEQCRATEHDRRLPRFETDRPQGTWNRKRTTIITSAADALDKMIRDSFDELCNCEYYIMHQSVVRGTCRSQSGQHNCECHLRASCGFVGPECKASNHVCGCGSFCVPEKCISEFHNCCCRCRRFAPEKCRALSEYHLCSCDPYGWRSCKAIGKHKDGRATARDVRALVVASYGSAPNAKTISSPVLGGFASLPHQLKLCVAEIAWMLAAAGIEDAAA